MNREVLQADELDPGSLVAAGRGQALFGGRRLVVVRGLGDIPARAVEELRAAIAAARREPGGWPEAGATVVLVAMIADRRAPVLRLAAEVEPVEVRGPGPRGVLGWVRDRARAAGLALTPGAAQALVDLVGDEPARLAAELEKAALYVASERQEPVTEEIVRALTGQTRSRRYWEMTEALERGHRADALRCLDALLGEGEEAPALLAWLSGHVRTLARVLGAIAEGSDARHLGATLRPPRPEFAVERLMARAQALGTPGVTSALARCLDAERRLKSGGGSPRALLTALVAELAL